MLHGEHTVIIGIGNAYRCDDSAGLVAARKIENLYLPNVIVKENHGDGPELIETWKNTRKAVVIDATDSGSVPGTIFRFELHEDLEQLEHFSGLSTHNLNIVQCVYLANALEQLPASLIMYGIEGKSFEFGTTLSPEIEQAIEQLVACIVKELVY